MAKQLKTVGVVPLAFLTVLACAAIMDDGMASTSKACALSNRLPNCKKCIVISSESNMHS